MNLLRTPGRLYRWKLESSVLAIERTLGLCDATRIRACLQYLLMCAQCV